MRVPIKMGVFLTAAFFAAGCEDMFAPKGTTASRNYDELISRMMEAIKGRTPEDAAINLFNVTSPDERRDAIAWLETKKWGHEEPYMRAYEILTTDPHPMVRAQAMMALGTSHKPEAVPYLIKGLADPDVQVRRDAATGLRYTWGEEAFPVLAVKLKEDPDDKVRANCARALANARTPDAVRALIDALIDRDAAVAKFSHDALVATTGQNLWYDHRAWLTWYQETYLSPTTQARSQDKCDMAMRSLHFDGTTVRPKSVPEPVPSEGEVQVRVLGAGICQTDLEIARGYMGFKGTLGHEFVGEVAKLGTGVDSQWLGKRVCAEINCVCGKCDMCQHGLSTHCPRRTVIGILNHDGAFAEFICVPVRNLHEVPANVSDEQAVFVEPLAAAFQIQRQMPIEKRTRVTILGDGRLGQLVAQALMRTGCTLQLVGHHESKLSLAERLGRGRLRTILERDLRGGRDQDVVIDCTGRAEGFERALTLVRPRGTVVLKTTVAAGKPLNLAPIVIDEITILGSRCGPFRDALMALAGREVDVEPLISRRVTLEEAAALFAPGAMAGMMKVLVRIQK